MLENLLMGFSIVLHWQPILLIIGGVVIGILVGATPGLNASAGVALLLPFTFTMDPAMGIVLLCALYSAAEYGGSITAITINTPGTPAAVATTFDGYQFTKKGQPGKALGASIVASTCGGMFSTIALIVLGVPLAEFALKFGPAEYFALGIFGLTIIASLSSRNYIKGFVAACIGLIIETVGMDPFTAYPRFTFGRMELLEGFSLIPALLGLFAISEVFKLMEEVIKEKITFDYKSSLKLPTLKEYKGLAPTILRGSIIGTFIGAMPGAGATIASLISYDQAKRAAKNPDDFGKGELRGVAAPESANNASVGGALIPLLTLGIPGSATTAILIGGLMMHNIQPGPMLFEKNPEIVFSLFASLFLANFFMLVLGLGGTKIWARVNSIPRNILIPSIMGISIVGSYSIGNSLFDVGVMIAFGILGYILHKFNFPPAPIVLSMVLGFIIESSARRAILQSGGDYLVFFKHPISAFLLMLALVSALYPIIKDIKARRKATINA
jgi:putative tricarboxylic transport membrane protein